MPVPSEIFASRIDPRRDRIVRSRTSSTSATIVTFSSSGRLASAVSSPRRAYLRG